MPVRTITSLPYTSERGRDKTCTDDAPVATTARKTEARAAHTHLCPNKPRPFHRVHPQAQTLAVHALLYMYDCNENHLLQDICVLHAPFFYMTTGSIFTFEQEQQQ